MVRKDRKKIVAELHHNKQERNEYPVILGKNVPVIKEIYDPLTGLRDGTITPNAPVVITGENLCLSSLGTIYLGLSPVSDKGTLIHVNRGVGDPAHIGAGRIFPGNDDSRRRKG